MKTGSFHFTSELEKDSLQEFLKAAEWRPRLQTNVQLYTSFLALDVRTPPLNDVRVRQALAYAVDRERIVRDIVGNERGMIARSLLPPGLPGNDPNTIGYIYDPSRARALLKQANVADGTRLEMWQVEESPGILQLLGLLQENLKDIGLGLQIRFVTSEELDAGTRKRNIPMRLTRWVADYPDPDSFLYVPFHSGSTVFNIGFSNAEFDRLVEEARCMADIQERMRLYQSAERIWMQECPCICLYHNRSLVLHQQKVQGCMPTFTTATVRLKKVWLS